MQRLLDALGSPHLRYGVVHVAGTKGKGSTVAMVAAILERGGHRVGRYMSPHVHDLEERISVNGRRITATDLVEACRRVARAMERLTGDDPSTVPTWFEVVTAMAMVHFSRNRVAVAVLETGLGGRLDATNVCDPFVSVITSVSLDHTAQLGRTVTAIAREKAGIVKPGRPVVSGVRTAAAARVVAAAADAAGARLYRLGKDFRIRLHREPTPAADGRGRAAPDRAAATGQTALAGPSLSIDLGLLSQSGERPHIYRLGMAGTHQADNAALAVAAVRLLEPHGFPVDSHAIGEGLASVRLPARVELIPGRPAVVVDAAHNVASMRSLIDTILAAGPTSGAVLVFSAARDKEVRAMLESARRAFDSIVLTRFTSNDRALDSTSLSKAARQAGFRSIRTVEPPVQALATARRLAGPGGLVCVAGSFFLAGEVRKAALRRRTAGR
jgi:dihydrofolate synthase/folylpolyglutamate synthase